MTHFKVEIGEGERRKVSEFPPPANVTINIDRVIFHADKYGGDVEPEENPRARPHGPIDPQTGEPHGS